MYANKDIFLCHEIAENPYEQNMHNGPQGVFRRGWLDLDLLKYAIESDPEIKIHKNKTLVITCMDLMGEFRFIDNGILSQKLNKTKFVDLISEKLNIKKVLLSYSPESKMQTRYSTLRRNDGISSIQRKSA